MSMTRVEIVGAANGAPFEPLHRRVVRRPLVVRMRFNLTESTVNKSAKLIGIAGFGGVLIYRRCFRGQLGDAKFIERENSDRVTGIWKRDHVLLRSYAYVRGSGATTDGTSFSTNLVRVTRNPDDPDWTHVVTVYIAPGHIAVPDWIPTKECPAETKYDAPRRARFQLLLGPHGRNGGEHLRQDERLIFEYEILP